MAAGNFVARILVPRTGIPILVICQLVRLSAISLAGWR